MGLREILAAGSFPFDKVRDRVKPQTVDTEIETEIEDFVRRGFHLRIVVVQIGLMRKESVPEIGFGNRIVGPIAYLVVFKDYPRFRIFLRIMGPYIVITPRISSRRSPRLLK